MATSQTNYNPKLPALWEAADGIRDPGITVFDVGASGGVDGTFSALGPLLRAVGFDPLVTEVERLTEENNNPNIEYIDAFIGGGEHGDLPDRFSQPTNHYFERSSSSEASRIVGKNYATEVFNRGAPEVWSERRMSLDEFVTERNIDSVDFIKIDTDGGDYAVLLGAEKMLKTCSVLALVVEVQFHGSYADGANLFPNIDLFLRREGFTLFDLDVYRYSRAALPAPFAYDLFGPTTAGLTRYGDAVYFRDLADPNYSNNFELKLTPTKILKTACLLEICGQNDSAAELLLRFRRELEPHINVDDWLDQLTPGAESYKELLNRFRSDPRSFCASNN